MGKKTKTLKERIEDIKINEKDKYEILIGYENTKTKLKVKCLTCGKIWEVLPSNFVKGNRCPVCSNKKKGQYLKSNLEEFIKFIEEETKGEYSYVSGDYINNNTKIRIKHNKCGHIYEVTPINFKKGRRCPKCSIRKVKNSNEYFLNRFKRIEDSIYYEPLEEYKGIDTKIRFLHKECGNEFLMTPNMFLGKGRRCPYCSPKTSNSEKRIYLFLKNHNIYFEKEYTFSDLKSTLSNYPLRFDFKINKNENEFFLLEYDGEQHFKSSGFITSEQLEILQEHDKLKDEYCKLNNIPLIRISYKKKYMLEKILLDLMSSTTIESKNFY